MAILKSNHTFENVVKAVMIISNSFNNVIIMSYMNRLFKNVDQQ
jgi:hypothetical protein